MRSISQAEKIDLLLVLSLAFQRKLGEPVGNYPKVKLTDLADVNFSALPETYFSEIKTRAAILDELSPENRSKWQENRFEKLQRRGRSRLLDENINASHFADLLSREPKTVQCLVLKNLPSDLSQRIAFYLDIDSATLRSFSDLSAESNVNEEIDSLIKRNFLANFVSFTDIFVPEVIDGFSVTHLEEFIYQIGLREVALACRGITTKEALAAFLNGFSEDDARRIAVFITELEDVKPFWVMQADEIVRKSWSKKFPPEKVIKIIGLKLLATGFAGREDAAQKYTAQKISVYDAGNWLKMVRRNEKALQSEVAEDNLKITKRQRSLERLAAIFLENGEL